MKYEIFKQHIEEYNTLYSQGMKKEANRSIQELCLWIDSLSTEEADILIRNAVMDLCETENFAFLFKRGNGQLPFQLNRMIQNWLLPRCQQGKMTELRWFFQIYKNDSNNAEYAYSCLDTAYARDVDDQKTQKLLFERNVEALEIGIHELPIGLLISDEEAKIIFCQCDYIIQSGHASSALIARYSAAKQEYDTYVNTKKC